MPSSRNQAQNVALLATEQLYETTRDICGRLDIEEALQAIVCRANTLLGGDLAYLATCDDDHRVMRMRAFDKVRSDRFKALVVPYEVGVGGAVATHRRPMTVEDYESAPGVLHVPEVDESAREEGIRSGVGAPVEFENRLLAVLFVAKRTPHRFSAQQVTMLHSLANAAAIAINNAQIHGRLVAAMGIHQSLMDLALSDRGAAAVTATLVDLVQGPALFLDWRGAVLADAPCGGRSLAAEGYGTLLGEDADTDNRGTTTLPIRIAGVVEGYLVVAPGASDPELAAVAIEQTVTVLALELMKMKNADQVELRLRGGIFTELLSYPHTDQARLLRQADQLGCDLRKSHVVAVVEFRDRQAPVEAAPLPWQRLAQLTAATCAQARQDALLVDRGDSIVVLVATEEPNEGQEFLRHAIEQARRARLPAVVAGLGRLTGSLADFQTSFAEASRAAEVARRLPSLGGLVRFDGLGLHQLLLGAQPSADLAVLARRMLDPLFDQDVRRGTELVLTARVFLECNGNVEAMARSLGMHPNSVRNRLSRMAKLLGRDLEDARTRLDLHLALETLALVSAEGRGSRPVAG
ncbi:MAG: helix-turn-helix domain-containing protein [Actinomycetota bacterium]|nr:helix-turn-helix domain-containing protein [Actinomycetota bacterium]